MYVEERQANGINREVLQDNKYLRCSRIWQEEVDGEKDDDGEPSWRKGKQRWWFAVQRRGWGQQSGWGCGDARTSFK